MYISGRLGLHRQRGLSLFPRQAEACGLGRTGTRLRVEMSDFKANGNSPDSQFDVMLFYPVKPASLEYLLAQITRKGHKAWVCLSMKLRIAHMGRVSDVA